MSQVKNLVAIKFDGNQKLYTFDANYLPLAPDDRVVVETTRGIELGTVSRVFTASETREDIKLVLRKATQKDLDDYQTNLDKARADWHLVEKAIREEELPMDILQLEYTLDQSKLIITYLSEKRVDFRNLLKSLTTTFPCRIELKQVGLRDRAKLVGGVGICGRELCCTQTRGEFDMITINMAKNQLLSLNIAKLSGQCGKLKCCLRYENDYYTDAKQGLPKPGQKVQYLGKQYRVTDMSVITHTLTLVRDEEVLVVTFNEYKEKAQL